MPDPVTVPESKGLAGRIAVWTASLLALAGLVDAVTAVFTKTESLTCSFGISLPWCASRPGGLTIADFTGEWTNKNPEAGIARVVIDQRLDKATVHFWGRCEQSECDAGTAQSPASDAKSGTLQVELNEGFAIRRAALTIGEGKRLEVTMKTHFTDESHRPDYEMVEYLERK